MAKTLQTTFADAFSCTEFHAFHPVVAKLCPKDQFIYKPAMVWIVAWRRAGDKPLSESMVAQLTEEKI